MKPEPFQLVNYRIANEEKHIEKERYALQQIEEVAKETKDEAVKLLLQHILEDEKKHHKIFQTIIKKVYMLTP